MILVVEDDYPLQDVVEDFLREGGFETHALSSGEEALTLFRGRVAEYRALVTDVSLKGTINGWEVAKQIREIAADFPVVYMTGARRPQQHPPAKTIRAGAAGDRRFPAAERGAAAHLAASRIVSAWRPELAGEPADGGRCPLRSARANAEETSFRIGTRIL